MRQCGSIRLITLYFIDLEEDLGPSVDREKMGVGQLMGRKFIVIY